MSFQNKVALVTGGGSGIGRVTALELAREGAAVVIGNRNVEQGEAVAAAIRDTGGRAVFRKTDVTKPDEAEALVNLAVSEFGKLDLAFNNAGVEAPMLPVHETDHAVASHVMAVNVMVARTSIAASGTRRGSAAKVAEDTG